MSGGTGSSAECDGENAGAGTTGALSAILSGYDPNAECPDYGGVSGADLPSGTPGIGMAEKGA